MQVKISLTSHWHIGFTYKIQCFIAYNSVCEDTGRKTFVTTTGGNVNWYKLLWEKIFKFKCPYPYLGPAFPFSKKIILKK